MESLLSVGKVLLLVLAVASVVLPLFQERFNYSFIWSVWKRFRIGMFFESLLLIILTLVAVVLLWQIPGLSYGWANFFFDGPANILMGPVLEGSKSSNIIGRLTVPLFLIALLLALPFLAKGEEDDFRKGCYEWKGIIKRSIKFGLIHCLVGIPLAAGIALILSGLFYGLKYKRSFICNMESMSIRQAEKEAVMVSTTYHTMYNTILVSFLLVYAFIAV